MKLTAEKHSVRTSLFAYLIPLLIFALITTYFAASSIISSERLERTNFLARIRTLADRARLELQIDIVKAYEAATTLSESEALVRWFSGIDDEVIKDIALSEVEALMSGSRFDVSFAARKDTENQYHGRTLAETLSREDPDDSWFYDSIAMDEKISINVDHNRELGKTMLWVNAQVIGNNEIIGVAGIGMNIGDIQGRLQRLAPGENGMILLADDLGRVRLAYPLDMNNKNLSDVLNNPSQKYIDLNDKSIFSFDRKDTIYTVTRMEDINLTMVIMAPVSDFLSSPFSLSRIYSIMSIALIIVLVTVFLLIIQKLRVTIIQQNKSQDITIHSMSMLAELKDQETGAHIVRTKKYCRILAEELSRLPEYKKYLTAGYIEDLERSAPLHDIGKVGIPDSILLKPGKLTAEEFEVIKTHTTMGARVLGEAMVQLQFTSYFTIGIQLVRHHHEKWDGSGYPEGLSGESIPLSARIMAIADVYDALRTERPYKEPFSHDKSMKIIENGSGTHFQPDLVYAFKKRQDDFRKISIEYADEEAVSEKI